MGWLDRLFERKNQNGNVSPPALIETFGLNELRPQWRSRNEKICRALCAATYLGEYYGILRVLCRVLGRYKMYVDPNDHGLSPHLMLDGYWEMSTSEAIAQLVEPGMIVGDVGANLGYFTLLMADLVGPSGKVYAFEPNPQMAFRAERSARLNGFADRVQVCQTVLYNENGRTVSFLMPSDEPKNAYARRYDGEDLTGSVLMDACRLDSRPEWLDCDMLKIDAEGSEQSICEGMSGLLAKGRLRIIVMEVRMSRYGGGTAFLLDILSHGFTMERIDDTAGIVPTTLEALQSEGAEEDVMLVLRR
jgi:FkbM family methyltransferase